MDVNKKPDSLFGTLLKLKGNQRACVYTEPLWGVPYNLYAPFFTLYMYSLNVKDVEIGILLSIGLFFQLFGALLGGLLTDKLGRRRTTIIFDFISWTIPCLIWAFAQNIWWFLAAAIINSLWQITQNSWQCLLVEDADPEMLVPVYNWIYICGLLAVFFAPLAGFFIGKFSLVPVMRVLLIISAVLMSTKFIVLYRCSVETTQGKVRMAETRGQSFLSMILEYKAVFFQIIKTPATLRVLALITLSNINLLITNNFFSLYATQDLSIPESFLSYFPMLRAALMFLFFLCAQNRLSKYAVRSVMLVGLGLYLLGYVPLLAARLFLPSFSVMIALLIAYTLCDACAGALFLPRRDSLLIKNVDPAERARIMSLIYIIMLGISSPFGYLAGWLSDLDRRLPFIFGFGLFLLIGVIVAKEDTRGEADE